jgi:hypothetical protein
VSGRSFYLDGREIGFEATGYAGARLLASVGASVKLPGPDEPPYLFCGNGACRDCNVLVDGFPDLPACRIPLAAGMSFRSGEGAGEPNALSRSLGLPPKGEPLVAQVLVVGAGPAGREAGASARRAGADALVVDARVIEERGVLSPCPAGVVGGTLSVLERGFERPVLAEAIVLANGARDENPRFPGATLAGVLPLDLLERYQALGHEIGTSFHVARAPLEIESVSGSTRVERVRIPGRAGELEVDLGFVRFRREPVLSLARALGCRTVYDRELSLERLAVGDEGETSVPGIYAAGDVAGIGSLDAALDAGRRAGRAAARFALRSS